MNPLPARGDTLLDPFDTATIARGRAVVARGDVIECTPVALGGAVAVSGVVRDGGSAPCQVYVMIEHGRVAGDCTCPLGVNCEHVAALVLAASEDAAGTTTDGRVPVLPPAARIKFPRHREPAAGGAHMVYLLDHPPGEPGLFVCAARASSVDAAALTPYAPGRVTHASQPAYVSADDLVILRRLAANSHGAAQWVPLGRHDGDLLTAIIASGRCYWKSRQNPALHQGESIITTPTWRCLESGAQRLAFDLPVMDGFQPLPLNPPWLLNPTTGVCRMLRCSSDHALALELMHAPDVAPREVDAVIRHIGLAAAPTAFPRPRRLKLKQARAGKPRPRLVLCQMPLAGADEPTELPSARLGFDYGGAVFDWDNPAPSALADDDVVIEAVRDPDYEQSCADVLLAHGLTPARDGLKPVMLPDPDTRGYWISSNPLAATENWVALQRRARPLRDAGWRLDIDPAFTARLVEPDGWYGDLITTGGDGFELDFGIILDSRRLSLLAAWLEWVEAVSPGQLRHLLNSPEESGVLMLHLDERRVVLMPQVHLRAVLNSLGELIDEPAALQPGRLRLPRARLGEMAALGRHWTLGGAAELVGLAERLAGFTRIESIPPPDALQAQLRPYQQAGLDWLQFLREFGFGGILADDMGLGKTVQALAHVLLEKQAGRLDRPVLVIAPTSLMFNWRAEARRFAPTLSVLTLHGPGRRLRFHEIPHHDLVLTTYPLVTRDIERLKAHRYHLLALDEAQAIKNPGAKLGRLLRQIDARYRLCLTGTPMENHLGELWSLFDFVMPDLLGGRAQFRRVFQTPIERHDDARRRDTLSRRIKPFFLRRTKQAVAPELPPKSNITRTVALADKQFKLYEAMRLSMHDKVRRALDEHGVEKSRIIVLDALLKLRQICCDPRLLKNMAAGGLAGSAKLDLLLEILPEMLAEGRRVLLFSQFVGMLDLIVPELNRRAIAHTLLTGRTRERARAIEHFQQGRVPLFLISLKAGGVGLNLTAADTVIHYDPWWNPAAEDQATDRAHRIGQQQKVFVYRLLTENTVEQHVHELQCRKRGLIEGLMRGGGARSLSAQDLESLFQPPG